MEWYNYVACFFAGAILTNFVPHFVHGISGDKFPTPFSKPHGIGLSSPLVNILWALFNLIVGFLLFKAAKISGDNYFSLIIFFIGVAFISIFSSKHFTRKDKN
jgi:hypothetical protein